jgi:hypothetical protein
VKVRLHSVLLWALGTPRQRTPSDSTHGWGAGLLVWSREKSISSAEIEPQGIGCTNCSPATILTELSRHVWAAIAHSVQRLATGWAFRESNPGEGEIFPTSPYRPSGPPSSLYSGYWFIPRGKSGRGVALTTHPHLAPT